MKPFGISRFELGKPKHNIWRHRRKTEPGCGTRKASNEVYIGIREGVVRAYTVKRHDELSRWDAALIKAMRGTPKQPDPNRAGYNIECRVNFDPESIEPKQQIH